MPGRCREAPDHVEDRVRPNGGKTVTKSLAMIRLGLPLSEKQIPQVVENPESGGKSKGALETAALRPRQVRYEAALHSSRVILPPVVRFDESHICQTQRT